MAITEIKRAFSIVLVEKKTMIERKTFPQSFRVLLLLKFQFKLVAMRGSFSIIGIPMKKKILKIQETMAAVVFFYSGGIYLHVL